MKIDLRELHVMAIVNVTPDSFYAGSRNASAEQIETRVRAAVEQGATIIDVGGYSSRPGADDISPDEEWRRIDRGIDAVRRVAPDAAVSVDTFRADVVRRTIDKWGGVIVNDISAGELDEDNTTTDLVYVYEDMLRTVAGYDVPYIAMHMRGTPATMQTMTDYSGDIADEVMDYFRRRIDLMISAGIRRENIVLDPGFGFAKTLEQNYRLMHSLDRLVGMGYPVLSGVSRKSMIFRLLGTTPDESLNGTSVLNFISLEKGANILRVHDVREAVEVVKIYKTYISQA